MALFRDHPGAPVPEKNFWTLWCKGRLTEADTPTIQLGATPSGPTSAHLHHPPIFFTGRMPFLLPNQQCQNTASQNSDRKKLSTFQGLSYIFQTCSSNVFTTLESIYGITVM